jgi:2-methylisocitrate lyase-like PEP mutase family enzyme
MTSAGELRRLLDSGLIHVPGCSDALGGRLIEQAGFGAAYVSGFALSATSLGLPDLGLVGLDDVVSATRRIRAATSLPLIVDIDTGFGGPLNVRRTVTEVEAAGAAAVQIEDQVVPKRCGHFEGKTVVSRDEAADRVAVAAGARREALVVARTDALAVTGIDDAVDRARRFVAAGADVVFVEAITELDELRRVSAAVPETPLLFNAVEGGQSPSFDDATLSSAGVRIVLHPVTLLLETIRAQRAALDALRDGRPATGETLAAARAVVGANDAIAFHDVHLHHP